MDHRQLGVPFRRLHVLDPSAVLPVVESVGRGPWDGLAILALLGDGVLETHCPVSHAPLRFVASNGTVRGSGVIHFLVPARRFWDDIGFT
ncbi:MAG: hypothetical protein OEW19_02195 [Acidobacteriota bacterium]|nr:hypothetical protein [Acidobacteriota bacterium]